MKNLYKKYISVLLSMAMTASLIISVDYFPASDGMSAEVSVAKAELPEEFFSAITVSSKGELFADGKSAGSSYGGISFDENSQLIFQDGNRSYDLTEAGNELGVQVMYNSNGEDVIVSPFSTARLIVKADNSFDSFGAISVTEQYEGLYLLQYTTISEAYAAYQRLSEDSSVYYVDPDAVCTVQETKENDERLTPCYNYTVDEIGGWGAETIGAKDFCRFLNEEKGDELPEIIVAVVDTGINYDHLWLKDRILNRGANFTLDGKNSAEDHFGHGSHCAGIVCSATGDNVKILPVKSLDDRGGGTTFSVYSGICYAVDHGADVISLSLGFYGRSNLLEDAVEYARKNNVAVCVAAGNEYCADMEKAGCTLPSVDYTITVGAMSESFECSAFSNRGAVDFSAPGEDILSCSFGDESACELLSGTSMATPFVAACFADILSYDPDLTVGEVYDYIKNNALDICDEGYDRHSGWGMVNLRNFRFDDVCVEPPKADVPVGMYDDPINVSLYCDSENADIYYTIDGAIPTLENGIKYDGTPICIDKTTTLRAVAVQGEIMSRYEDYKYFIGEIDPKAYSIDSNGVLWEYDSNESEIDLRALVEEGKIPSFTAIGNSAFKRNNNLEEIILPPEVTIIGEGAFLGCGNLRRVTMNAETICKDAFSSCKNLAEVNDSRITKVADNAFYNCERLSLFDGTKLTAISYRAFYGCTSLDLKSFDPTIIESYGIDGFNNSGISGILDAAAAVSIGARAFENTHLTEVLLPDSIETIPERAFKGCSSLKYISAPGLKCVERYGLALGKREFTPDTAVRADIDFSQLVTVRNMAFEGYVFDKPESFDSLDSGSSLIAFAGAYGTKLSFPSLECITIGDYSYTEIDDVFVDLIEMPNLVKFSNRSHLGKCGALLIGDPESGVKLNGVYADAFAEGGSLFVYEDNETVRQMAEINNCDYEIAPAVYCPKEHYILKKGQKSFITAYGMGEGCSGEWFIKNADGIKAIDVSENMPVCHESDVCGSFTYIYRLSDNEDNIIEEKEIAVDVIDEEFSFMKIEENGFDIIDEQDYYELDEGYRLYHGKFTAEKGGEYFIYINRAKITCSENGNIIFTGGNDTNSTIRAEFEAGKTYDISIVLTPKDDKIDFKSTGIPYIAIHNSDDPRGCLSSLFRSYSIKWDKFIGNENYKPDIYISDSNRYLSQGYDFEIVFDEPPHYGTNKYTVQGIGEYFGILDMGEVVLEEGIKLNEWYDCSDERCTKFIPSEDGLYKLVICPDESIISKAENYGTSLNYAIFDTLPEIIGETSGSYSVTHFKPGFGMIDKGFSMSQDMLASVIEMKSNSVYSVTAGHTKNRYMITQDTLLKECTVEYGKNYQFNGEAVIPDICIYAPNGEMLVVNEDYTVRVWNNTSPGIMYAYIEGVGKYPGCICLSMAIEGGNVVALDDGNLRILPDGDVKLSVYTDYKLIIDEDTFINVEKTDDCNSCTLTISSQENDYFVEIEDRYRHSFIPAGTYNVYSNCSEGCELMCNFTLHSDLIDINDTEISLKTPEYGSDDLPEIEVFYDGELLEEKTDYKIYKKYDKDHDIDGVVISGMNDFAGKVNVDYISFPVEKDELPVLSEGISAVHSDSEFTEGLYRWTPEKNSYTFSVGTVYAQLYMIVSDENGRIICRDDLNKWNFVNCDVIPDNEYLVKFYGDNCDDFELVLSEKLKPLEQCEISYENVVEFGTSEIPVVFTDDDKVLVEGTDYIRLKDCGQVGIGPYELVFEGIGDYCGQVYVPVHLYTETVPNEKIYELTENFKYRVGKDTDDPGTVSVLRFTAQHKGTAEYSLMTMTTGKNSNESTDEGPASYCTYDAVPAKYSSVFIYDGSGNYLGTKETEGCLTMKQGETRYVVIVAPYIWDREDVCREKELDVMISYVNTVKDALLQPVEATVSTSLTTSSIYETTATACASETTASTTGSVSTNATVTTALTTTALPTTTKPITYGDPDDDGKIDASDATLILIEYSAMQTGASSTLNDRQRIAADINLDGKIDSSDASLVLAIYSHIQTGGT